VRWKTLHPDELQGDGGQARERCPHGEREDRRGSVVLQPRADPHALDIGPQHQGPGEREIERGPAVQGQERPRRSGEGPGKQERRRDAQAYPQGKPRPYADLARQPGQTPQGRVSGSA